MKGRKPKPTHLRLVTGNAIDPQTWDTLSDHELQFLSERFRALPTYMQSRVHEEFAEDFLRGGDARSAARAARSAVNIERTLRMPAVRVVLPWST